MSYYQVVSWDGTPITQLLQENRITYFVGDDTECHLNISDELFLGRLWFDLTDKFDVMMTEQHGTRTIWLDKKNGKFRQR